MQNIEQNSEIMYIKLCLLQDLLKKHKKIQNQFQNGLALIGKIRVKKDKEQIFFKPKKYKI